MDDEEEIPPPAPSTSFYTSIPTGSIFTEVEVGRMPRAVGGRAAWKLDGRIPANVSRLHCVLRLHQDGKVMVKCCSTYGTYLCANLEEEETNQTWVRAPQGNWTTVPGVIDADIPFIIMLCNPTPLRSAVPSASTSSSPTPMSSAQVEEGEEKSARAKKRCRRRDRDLAAKCAQGGQQSASASPH